MAAIFNTKPIEVYMFAFKFMINDTLSEIRNFTFAVGRVFNHTFSDKADKYFPSCWIRSSIIPLIYRREFFDISRIEMHLRILWAKLDKSTSSFMSGKRNEIYHYKNVTHV